LALNTKVKTVAMTRHTALQQLLDTGDPVSDLVLALRKQKLTIEAVTECVRMKRPFDSLRPSTWPLLGDAIDQYVAAQSAKELGSQRTADSSQVALNRALEFFGPDRGMESITHEEVTAYKAWLRERGLSGNTIALYLLKFGALYTFLQKRETKRAKQAKRVPFVLFSPMERDEHMPAVVKTRARHLSEEEADRLLSACPPSWVAALALGLFAGLRRGEVAMLRPMDVDLDGSVLFVQARDGWTPKYRKNREVPISSALETYLRPHVEAAPDGAAYLFPGQGRGKGNAAGMRTIDSVMERVTKDAEIADLFTVARLLGHSNTKQVEETYAHLSPQHKLATVEMLTTRWMSREVAE
jgi:integrase